MTISIEAKTDPGTRWPEDGIETLGHCPMCGSSERTTLYTGLRDRLFGAPGQWTLRRCSSCRLGYLDPRPDEPTIGLAYANYITHEAPKPRSSSKALRTALREGYLTHRYGYHHLKGPKWGYWLMWLLPAPLRREWDHWARHLAPPGPSGGNLLDIGSGNGRFLADAQAVGWTAKGIEPDPEAAAVARAAGLDVTAGSYRHVEFPDASFDVVTADEVIEHVHDPHLFVECIRRWLKPGGHVWIATPNLDCPIHARYGRDFGNLHPPQHLLMFNPRTLTELFAGHGFTDIHFVKRGFYDYGQTLASAALERGMEGPAVYRGVRGAPLLDRFKGVVNEITSWLDARKGSDLILVARKPA